MENKIYITTNDIMRKYSITRGTVHNWRKEGMPCIKIGYIVRFDPEEVDRWIKTRK